MKKDTELTKRAGLAILLVLTILIVFAIVLIISGRTVYVSTL